MMINDIEYQRTVALNNQGVALLQLGDIDSAHALFRATLQLTVGLLDHCDSPISHTENCNVTSLQAIGNKSHSEQQSNTNAVPTQQPNFGRQRFCQLDEQRLRASTFESIDGTSVEHVFVRAINLVPDASAYSDDALVSIAIVSAISLFNLGIVYHLFGSHCHRGSSIYSKEYLLNSQALYSKSLDLLKNAGVPTTQSCGHSVIDVVTMAIYNNLGQSFFSLTDYAASQSYFDKLVCYAASVAPEAHDVDTGAILQFHKSLFLLNAMTLHPPVTASAA